MNDPRTFEHPGEAATDESGEWNAYRLMCWISKRIDPLGEGLELSRVTALMDEAYIKAGATPETFMKAFRGEIRKKNRSRRQK